MNVEDILAQETVGAALDIHRIIIDPPLARNGAEFFSTQTVTYHMKVWMALKRTKVKIRQPSQQEAAKKVKSPRFEHIPVLGAGI